MGASADRKGLAGTFITFEGDDGVGKSTHIRLLAESLEELGYEVVTLREPGGTSIGEQLRAIVLDPKNPEMTPETELLIYEAARAQIVSEVIMPALERGAVVLCDRFADSTIAYQGFGRGLDIGFIESANSFASLGLAPARTLLMTCPDSTSKTERLSRRESKDRLDSADGDFHANVSAGFAQLSSKSAARIKTIDASGSYTHTARQIAASLEDLFPEMAGESVYLAKALEKEISKANHRQGS